jgi:hypothetical protein
MADKEEIKLILQSILESNTFKDSPIYKNLLSYLVESNLTDNIPKEVTIAIEIFGKDTSFNSNKDSTVRYHIHMLRKKLDNYYKNEGKADKFRIIIPKGHYEIKYIPSKPKSFDKYKKIIPIIKRKELIVIIILIFLNMFFAYHLFLAKQTKSKIQKGNIVSPDDPIWGSFFRNGYPVSLILGDDFLLDEYCPEFDRYRHVRDWEIDSENDLSGFLLQYPTAKLWKSEMTLVPFGGADNLMDILPIVCSYQRNVSLRMSSSLSLREIRNHNMVFMGEFKNLRVLEQIIRKTPIRFQYYPEERLFILNDNGDTLDTYLRIEAPYEQKDKYNVDYSLLIKSHGFTDENFIFIVGFGYGGRIERTRMLSDSKLRSQLYQDILKINKKIPDYFIVLFEVKSIERTGITNEIKYFKELSKDLFSD